LAVFPVVSSLADRSPKSYERRGRRELPRIGHRRSPVRAWLVSLLTIPFVCQRGGVDPLGGIECTRGAPPRLATERAGD